MQVAPPLPHMVAATATAEEEAEPRRSSWDGDLVECPRCGRRLLPHRLEHHVCDPEEILQRVADDQRHFAARAHVLYSWLIHLSRVRSAQSDLAAARKFRMATALQRIGAASTLVSQARYSVLLGNNSQCQHALSMMQLHAISRAAETKRLRTAHERVRRDGRARVSAALRTWRLRCQFDALYSSAAVRAHLRAIERSFFCWFTRVTLMIRKWRTWGGLLAKARRERDFQAARATVPARRVPISRSAWKQGAKLRWELKCNALKDELAAETRWAQPLLAIVATRQPSMTTTPLTHARTPPTYIS